MSVATSDSTRRPRHRDSPRTRRLARAARVDLDTVTPTGSHGRATADDVSRAAASRAGAPAPDPGTPAVAPQSPAQPVAPQATEPAAPQAAEPTASQAAEPAAPQASAAPPARSTPPAPTAPAPTVPAGAQASSLLEVDVTALLRRAGAADDGAARAHLLAVAAGSLARAAGARRPDGLPAGPVAVRVRDDRGRAVTLDGADLLSADGLSARLASATADGGTPSAAVLDVGGTSAPGVTVEVPPVKAGVLASLTVGPAVRRPVVVHGDDGQEQIGIRSLVWLALSVAGGLDTEDASALLARVGDDLRLAPAVTR